jgi:hypothetical protein
LSAGDARDGDVAAALRGLSDEDAVDAAENDPGWQLVGRTAAFGNKSGKSLAGRN